MLAPDPEPSLAGFWRLVGTGPGVGWAITEARCVCGDGTTLTFQVGRARYLEDSEARAAQAWPLPAGLRWERALLRGVYT